VEALLKEIMDDFNPGKTEFRILLPQGEVRTVWAAWKYIFDDNNKPVKFTGAVQDISEQKELESALYTQNREMAQAKQNLESANKELQQFTYVVSHDLKTPLRAIRNYKDFLDEDLKEKLTGDVKTYFDGIGKAVDEAENLVNDLLTLSRVGRKSPGFEKIRLKSTIEDICSRINSDDSALIDIDVPDDLSLLTDILAFKQIITNLISNGLKFNKSDPKKITVSADLSGGDEEQISLRFSDNGIGIEKKYQAQIFELFERLHLKEEYDGTGVGLAIVRKAVDFLGGSISIESVVGKGTEITVLLPIIKGD
jgi:two-component system CheB/CheR fusion protein